MVFHQISSPFSGPHEKIPLQKFTPFLLFDTAYYCPTTGENRSISFELTVLGSAKQDRFRAGKPRPRFAMFRGTIEMTQGTQARTGWQ